MSWSPSRPSAARRFVDRIAGAQRRHFGTDVVDQDILHLATCRGIEDATDKAPHLLEGGSVETTRGQRRRAETNTRCHESFLRIEGNAVLRSEEHTSELQSLMRTSYAVFCLKKK